MCENKPVSAQKMPPFPTIFRTSMPTPPHSPTPNTPNTPAPPSHCVTSIQNAGFGALGRERGHTWLLPNIHRSDMQTRAEVASPGCRQVNTRSSEAASSD